MRQRSATPFGNSRDRFLSALSHPDNSHRENQVRREPKPQRNGALSGLTAAYDCRNLDYLKVASCS